MVERKREAVSRFAAKDCNGNNEPAAEKRSYASTTHSGKPYINPSCHQLGQRPKQPVAKVGDILHGGQDDASLQLLLEEEEQLTKSLRGPPPVTTKRDHSSLRMLPLIAAFMKIVLLALIWMKCSITEDVVVDVRPLDVFDRCASVVDDILATGGMLSDAMPVEGDEKASAEAWLQTAQNIMSYLQWQYDDLMWEVRTKAPRHWNTVEELDKGEIYHPTYYSFFRPLHEKMVDSLASAAVRNLTLIEALIGDGRRGLWWMKCRDATGLMAIDLLRQRTQHVKNESAALYVNGKNPYNNITAHVLLSALGERVLKLKDSRPELGVYDPDNSIWFTMYENAIHIVNATQTFLDIVNQTRLLVEPGRELEQILTYAKEWGVVDGDVQLPQNADEVLLAYEDCQTRKDQNPPPLHDKPWWLRPLEKKKPPPPPRPWWLRPFVKEEPPPPKPLSNICGPLPWLRILTLTHILMPKIIPMAREAQRQARDIQTKLLALHEDVKRLLACKPGLDAFEGGRDPDDPCSAWTRGPVVKFNWRRRWQRQVTVFYLPSPDVLESRMLASFYTCQSRYDGMKEDWGTKKPFNMPPEAGNIW